MHPSILDTAGRTVFVPVRHHSPACAQLVRALAHERRPAAILIEGPSDFNERLGELDLPHTLPIAIYSYVRLDDDTRRGAFYPFCEYSPEWQALLVAREVGAHARFIDLPWSACAAFRTVSHRYADRELRESPYIPTLCRRLGVEDFDSLWDLLVEIDPALTPAQVLERVHQLCYHIRATSAQISQEDLRREAFMAAQIRSAQATAAGPILVVTGGFHSYALFAQLNEVAPAESDEARAEPEETLNMTPVEQGIALTPYADARLDSLTGYEAGMASPGFYQRAWADRAAGRADTHRALLAQAVAELRRRGQVASTADLIAVETSARALAALRGQPQVWRQDLIDAITGTLIKEALAPDTRHPLLDALLAVFRGARRGALAAGTALPPLVRDIHAQLAAHQLAPTSTSRTLRLELAAPADLARSRVLHRLRILGIRGFERREGTDWLGRADLTTIWEAWQIGWSPDFDASCIEAAIYGAALGEAATARLVEQAAALERSAERAALLLLDACLAGLGAQAAALFERLTALVRHDADFFSVAVALGHLLYLYRYEDTLGAVGRADIGVLLVETFERALWLLETLGQPQGRERELLRAFAAIVQTCEAGERLLGLDRAELAAVLRRAAGATAARPLVRGAATGALWTLGAAAVDQVRADLASCAAPEQLGDFLTGLFALARESAQRHPELVAAIDALVMGFDDEAYLQALPALRLAFSFFTPREKHYLARTLLAAEPAAAALPDLEVGPALAARALAAEARLLGALARYGIRGGPHGG